MPRRNQTYIETPVGSSRRRHRSGRLLLRTTLATGRQSYYGSWYCGRRRVKRCIGSARRRGERNGGLTEQQAEAKLRDMIAAADAHAAEIEQLADRLTVAQVGAAFVKNAIRLGRKKGTIQDIESDIRAHYVPYFGEKPFDEISYEDVEGLIASMERRGLAPKTIRDHVGTLSSFYTFAMAPKRRWAITNPCIGVDLPAAPEPEEIRFLTLEEVDLLLAHVLPGLYADSDRELLLTAIMTGMRKGELVALRWRDVDWAAGRIRVRRNFARNEMTTPKSRRGRRSIPMTGELSAALAALHDRARRRRPDDLVFPHPETGDVQPKANITRRFRRYLIAADLDSAHRFHDLRHTFGTLMAAAGVPMRTLQEWMGHRDISTTQKYADYAPSAHEGEMVAAAFARSSPQPGPSRKPQLVLLPGGR